MGLQDLRKKIDEIDDDLTALFFRRMDISAEIALYKKQNDLPVFDPEREKRKLSEISAKAPDGRKVYIQALYSLIFELSRAEQDKIINDGSADAGNSHNISNTAKTLSAKIFA